MTSPSLSRDEIFIHIFLNLLGSIELNYFFNLIADVLFFFLFGLG